MAISNFLPADHQSVTLAATVASAARQFRADPSQYDSVRVTNLSTSADLAYVRLGAVSPTASVPAGAVLGDFAVDKGTSIVLPVGQALFIAAICPTATATLVITPGQGQ